ncbi:hypothetical protein [Mycobacteroides abscessus]|uniref:hypothetical protein n=1 Tax=Mycobacteroides abscessus TaxID=36809 RepID=UPI000C269BC8|nr:hypothetical protein [Mycobacteroides abscessus]
MRDPATIADMVAVLVNDATFPASGRYGGLMLNGWADGDKVVVVLPNPVEVCPPKVFELSVRRIDRGFPPPMTQPSLGAPVGAGLADHAASVARAHYWSLQLAQDPVYGADSGFIVGVADAPDDDGIWALVWANQTDPV